MLPLCFHHDSLWKARLVGCIVRASPMLVEQSPGTAAKWYMIVQHTIGKELHDDTLCTAAPSSSSLGWCIIYLCEMKSGERCILVIALVHFQGIQTPVHMVCWTLMVAFMSSTALPTALPARAWRPSDNQLSMVSLSFAPHSLATSTIRSLYSSVTSIPRQTFASVKQTLMVVSPCSQPHSLSQPKGAGETLS